MKKSFFCLVALALILVALAGCAQPGGGDSGTSNSAGSGGSSGSGSFVGTWQYRNDEYSTLEFRGDMTFTFNNGGNIYEGIYVVDGNQATLSSITKNEQPNRELSGVATIDGNTLKFLGGEFIRQ